MGDDGGRAKPPPRVAVLSGTHREAVDYCRRQKFGELDDPHGPIFVVSVASLYGLRDYELHRCGTWYLRADLDEIFVYSRGAMEVDDGYR